MEVVEVAGEQKKPELGELEEKTEEEEKDEKDEKQAIYIFASTQRRGTMLHLANGCWRARARRFQDYELSADHPPKASWFTGFCKDCWPKGSSEFEKEHASSSSSSSSASSS